jgi:hypothetical protein
MRPDNRSIIARVTIGSASDPFHFI